MTGGIEMFTLEQDAQLLELLLWKKELLLAGIAVSEYCGMLDARHAKLLGSDSQLLGITLGNLEWTLTLYFIGGTWRVLSPGTLYSVTFEMGLEQLREFVLEGAR